MAEKKKTSTIKLEPIEVTADGGEIYSMNDLEMVELQTAASLEDYHTQLSQIIKKIRGFSDEELERLAEVVSRPWKRRCGRPNKTTRDVEILEKHFIRKEAEPRTTRKIVLEEIQKDHRIGDEGALSVYKKLSRSKKKKTEK